MDDKPLTPSPEQSTDQGFESTKMVRSTEANQLGTNYTAVLFSLSDAVYDAKREFAASLLRICPQRPYMRYVARETRQALNAMAVEVNVIHQGEQVTLAVSPGAGGNAVPVEDSLCVLTVGINKPLAVTDIQDDPFTEGHAGQVRHIGSWLSYPIEIDNAPAGSICALQGTAREWTAEEENILYEASQEIVRIVEDWLDEHDRRG